MARFTLGDYRRTSSVSSMLHQLIKWDDLITRRHQSKVTMIYRVIHQLVAIPSAPYLQPTGVRTRGNEMRFLVPFTSVNSYKNSFFPSTLEQSSIRYHKNAIPRGFQGRDCFQLPLDQPQMFLTRSFYPAPVNICKYTNRPSLTCT